MGGAGGSYSHAFCHHDPPPDDDDTFSHPTHRHHPPPPPPGRLSSPPSSASNSPPPPPPGESDSIGHSREKQHRHHPSLWRRELPTDLRGHTDHIIDNIFCKPTPHPSKYRRDSDDDTAELAVVTHFIRLGRGHLHVLPEPEPREEEKAGAPLVTAKEMPEGVSPPAEDHPSCRPQKTAAIQTISFETGKKKATTMKRGEPDFPDPSLFPSSSAGEHFLPSGKTSCARPNPLSPPVSPCFLDTGVVLMDEIPAVIGGPPLADHAPGGTRKLPPSILCLNDWEDGGVGDNGCTLMQHRQALPQAEQEVGGKAPGCGGRAGTYPPRVFPSEGHSWSVVKAETVSLVDVIDLDNDEVDEPHSPSMTTLVEKSQPTTVHTVVSPSRVDNDAVSLLKVGSDVASSAKVGSDAAPLTRVGSDTVSPLKVSSDGISQADYINVLVKCINQPNQTLEDIDLLEVPTRIKDMQLPQPKWWRPGGYGRRPFSEDK